MTRTSVLDRAPLYRRSVRGCGVLLALLLLLAGCTTAPSPTPQAAASATPTATQEATKTPTPLSSYGLTTLKLWVPDIIELYDETGEGSLFMQQIESFSRRNRDVQIDVQIKKAQGEGGLYDLLSATAPVAPSLLPDLIIFDRADLARAAAADLIQPLPEDSLDEAEAFPFVVEAVQLTNRTYGLPLFTQVEHTAYYPRPGVAPPLTWTAVLSGGYSLLMPTVSPDDLASDALLAAYRGTGGAVVDDAGNPLLERQHLEALYGFYGGLVEAGLLNPQVVGILPDASASWAAFQDRAGTLAVVPGGEYWRQEERIGEASWIPTPDGRPAAVGDVWAFALVTEDPERQAVALKFAAWLAASRQVADSAPVVGMLPTRQASLLLWPLSAEELDFLNALLLATEPSLPPGVNTPVRRALQAGLRLLLEEEGTTAEEAATYALTVLRK
ncbi:MAG: extracellular solute-binding protein [Anaerolineales bacterium]